MLASAGRENVSKGEKGEKNRKSGSGSSRMVIAVLKE